MQQAGYRVVYDQTQLSQMKLGKNEKLLGLFCKTSSTLNQLMNQIAIAKLAIISN
jgi:alkaline phosphatase